MSRDERWNEARERAPLEPARAEASERGLIEGAKNGDKKAFDDLCKRERPYLYNLMLQLTADEVAADDLTQEALFKVLCHISSFRHESSFRTWLTRIAINLFRKNYRERLRHASLDLETVAVPAERDNPERLVIKSELQWCIVHHLRYHLPQKYREVLILRDLHHLSYGQIAEILACSVDQVRINLHRARRMFRARFIDGKCRAFTDDYLCICEGILEL